MKKRKKKKEQGTDWFGLVWVQISQLATQTTNGRLKENEPEPTCSLGPTLTQST